MWNFHPSFNHRVNYFRKNMSKKKAKVKPVGDIRKHRRVIDTFTGPIERPVLRWMAEHMPTWVTPDFMTAVGVLGALIVAASYWLSSFNPNFLWLASFGFFVNCVGDSLDGTIARVRKIERPLYGFFIDHIVDAATEVMIILGLGLSPYVRFDLACLGLIGYLMLSVLVYLRTCVKGEFQLSYVGLGPTEARLIVMSANTLIYFIGNPLLTLLSLTMTVYDWIVVGMILLMLGIFLGSSINQARILAAIDAVRKEQP